MVRDFLKRYQFVRSLSKLRVVLSRGEQMRCVLILGLTIIGAGLDLLLVGIIPLTVAIVKDPTVLDRLPFFESWFQQAQTFSQFSMLKWASIAVVATGVVKLVYFFGMQAYILNTGRHIRVRVSRNLLQGYLSAPWTFHVGASKAELLRKLNADIQELVFGVVQPLIGAVYGLFLTLLILGGMIATLPLLVIIVFGITAIGVAGIMSLLSTFLRRHGENAKVQNKLVLREAQESLAHFVEVQLSGRDDWFLNRFARSVDGFSRSQAQIQLVNGVLPSGLELISLAAVMILVLVLTSSGGTVGAVLPEIALITVGSVRLRQSTTQLTSSVVRLQFSVPALEQVYKDLERFREGALRAQQPVDRVPFQDRIELEHVSFAYPEKEGATLTDVSLTIRRGETVAFTGETGCGKSTLLRLILGLLEPRDGSLRVDGFDVAENIRGWQANIAYVPQSICLLDTTIRENIALGLNSSEVDPERMQQAIEVASLENLIDSVSDGLDTHVGDNGSKLSGGQRQRIGIARAVYQRADVLVLDEATSALDQQTEMSVMNALTSLPGEITIILVTHRLKAIEAFDQVIELTEGRYRPPEEARV